MFQKILFLILVFNFFSCTLFQTTENTDALLPSETETPGWKLDGPVKEFTNNNLREYIKEPELTLLNTYGFKELYTAKYKNISRRNNEITAEIFTMDSPLNAFGILSMERVENSKEENLSDYSYSTPVALFFVKDNYYIKIKSGSEYMNSIEDLRIFSKIILDKIKDANPLPRYLSLFEKKDNKDSLIYWIGGHPKLQILREVFTRKTDIFEKNKTVLFTKRDSSYISMGEFSNLLKNKQFILSNAGDSQTAFLKLNDNDYIFISVFKEWIFGINSESMAEGEKSINFLFNDLKDYIKGYK
jgi:hypothetical protein